MTKIEVKGVYVSNACANSTRMSDSMEGTESVCDSLVNERGRRGEKENTTAEIVRDGLIIKHV